MGGESLGSARKRKRERVHQVERALDREGSASDRLNVNLTEGR